MTINIGYLELLVTIYTGGIHIYIILELVTPLLSLATLVKRELELKEAYTKSK